MTEHVLVIGAGGFIGRHLVQSLSHRAQKVIAVGRHASTIDPHPFVTSVVAELRTPDQFRRLLDGCSAVVHVASASTPGSTAGDPLAELQGNLVPTLALLDALQSRLGIPLLYISSGGTLYADDGDQAASETAALQPRSYHGAGKAAAEQFIAAWCRQFDATAVALRPSNVYGPGQDEKSNFGIVPTCFGKMLRNEILSVWGDGSAIRDYLFIDDFIALILDVLSRPGHGWQVLNAASGDGTSLNELFSVMEAVAERPLARHYDPGRRIDASGVVVDPRRAHERYQWTSRIGLRDGLEKTWQWFKSTRP